MSSFAFSETQSAMPSSFSSSIRLSRQSSAVRRSANNDSGTESKPVETTLDPKMRSPHEEQEEEKEPKRVSNGSMVTNEKVVIKYGECRKNHAANIGDYAVDGCREFMASGKEGTSAAFICAACNCHRNFHKKEGDGEICFLSDSSSDSTRK